MRILFFFFGQRNIRTCMKKSNIRVRKSSSGYKMYYYLFNNVVSDIHVVTEITGT